LFDVGDVKQAAKELALISDAESLALSKEARKLVEIRYSKEASVELWKHAFKCITQDITSQSTHSKMMEWTLSGKIERLEWPHASSLVSENDEAQFAKVLNSVESET